MEPLTDEQRAQSNADLLRVLMSWWKKARKLAKWEKKLVWLMEHPFICKAEIVRYWNGDKPHYFQLEMDLDEVELEYLTTEDDLTDPSYFRGDSLESTVEQNFDLILRATEVEIATMKVDQDYEEYPRE